MVPSPPASLRTTAPDIAPLFPAEAMLVCATCTPESLRTQSRPRTDDGKLARFHVWRHQTGCSHLAALESFLSRSGLSAVRAPAQSTCCMCGRGCGPWRVAGGPGGKDGSGQMRTQGPSLAGLPTPSPFLRQSWPNLGSESWARRCCRAPVRRPGPLARLSGPRGAMPRPHKPATSTATAPPPSRPQLLAQDPVYRAPCGMRRPLQEDPARHRHGAPQAPHHN